MIRPSLQPCSLLTGDDSVAPAPSALRMMLSGSSTTSSVRLVAPSMAREPPHARRCSCHPKRCVANGELRDDVVSVADTVNDACAERGFVERDGFARSVDPQFRLDTRHGGSLP
jgi:hypothetical protein